MSDSTYGSQYLPPECLAIPILGEQFELRHLGHNLMNIICGISSDRIIGFLPRELQESLRISQLVRGEVLELLRGLSMVLDARGLGRELLILAVVGTVLRFEFPVESVVAVFERRRLRSSFMTR